MTRISVILFTSLLLAGCAGGRSDGGNATKHSPAPVIDFACPVKHLDAQGIVDRVRAFRDEEASGMVTELRAGYLAVELANAGVPDSILLTSFSNGKFAALVSWLSPNVTTVDINKFSNCEGY